MTLDDKARQKAVERARSLEKAGQGEAALKIFREAGAVDDAVRVLGAMRRPKDAAQLLLESLGVQPAQVSRLDSPGRKRALMAAILLGKAGENDLAVQLFMGLGEQGRAVELLQRAGDHLGAARLSSMKPGQFDTGPLLAPARATAVGGQAISVLSAQKMEEQGKLQLALEAYVQLKRFPDAARLARQLGQTAQAAQLFADAGQAFQAAEAYLELGDTGKALDNLTRVPREDPIYRTAAAQAVRLAVNLNLLDFRLEHFLGAFVKSGPQGAQEAADFELLATLYASLGYPENAREALQKIVAADPANESARRRLAEADEELRPSTMTARQVLAHADLHKKRTFDDLPGLEDLPGVGPTMVRHDPELVRQVTDPGAAVAHTEELALDEADVLDDLPGDTKAPLRGGHHVPDKTRAEQFAVGSTVAARYKLEAQIGKGGMAWVFRAWDIELEEQVALKVFNVQQITDVAVARFKQELKLSRQLIHPNIIRLYDIGVHQGHRYISMELLTGKTLKDRLPVDLRTALGFLLQACHGLQAAHDAAVVHRDVKPDNFFITDDGVLKVMDFGIAKQHATPGVTVAGSIAGTPLYMSPEQISNFSTVSHLADLYALGVCAYEMLTGRVPFNHPELVPLLMMHVNDAPQPLRKLRPELPAELDAAVLKLLAKDPAQRFASCRELARELSAIRDGLPA